MILATIGIRIISNTFLVWAYCKTDWSKFTVSVVVVVVVVSSFWGGQARFRFDSLFSLFSGGQIRYIPGILHYLLQVAF